MNQLKSPISVLQAKKERLVHGFLKGDEPNFPQRHAEVLDDYFQESYAVSSVGPHMHTDKNPYAIIALGGYGRQEQCIHSDVDVMLLFKKKIPDETKALVQEVFYPLWDIGLDISYATRTIKESYTLASRNFEVLTALMDARFICGISPLYSELMERLRSKVVSRHRSHLVKWLLRRNRERHARFGDSTYLLEPNLKEGLGGLRDYHTMFWVARTVYNVSKPRDLEFLGHLSHDEFHSLSKALGFIRDVRSRLHYLTGRKCDQLYFEYQVKLAEALGFKPQNGQQPVEGFLGALHSQMQLLKRQHLMFLNKVESNKKKIGRKKAERRTVSAGIELSHDALEFESPEAILERPYLLIKIFEQSAVLALPLSMEASRLVNEFLYLIDEGFRRSRKVVKSFQQILRAPLQTFNVLKEMFNTGIMVALVPEMKGIVDRIQYDEYHVYPVDTHCLRTVQTLKEFRDGEPKFHNTSYEDLFREIPNPDLLLWAGLLHDVGKAEDEHDHPSQGAQITRDVLERMNLAQEDIETVSFLVREHLLLIHTATRRDINDEKTVIQCARDFRDVHNLKMLYLLTIADSMATGPKAWSDWKDMLLKELFGKVLHVLEKGELATPAAADVVRKKRHDILLKGTESLSGEALETLFDQMSPRYLLYTPSKDILQHIELYQRLSDEPLVLEVQADPHAGSNYRTATICARDFPGLFSKIAGVFTLNNMDILSAQINTWRNHIALDVFKIKAPPDRLREDEIWDRVKTDLQTALKGELALEPALGDKMRAYQPLQKEILRKPNRIVVDNESSDFFTVVEVYTHDFPGLLYRITDALFRCKLDIWVAKIGTKVDQVVDVFYLRDFDGQKVHDPVQVSFIKESIKAVLTDGLSTSSAV
jgi:[protein-PII] uridylyltransferase